VLPCCRGGFFNKLRTVRGAFRLESWTDLLSPEFLGFLGAVAEELGVAIADVERDHAHHRAMSTGAGKAPATSLERLRYDSILQAWLREHLRRGHPDPRATTTASLAARGVETMAVGRRGRRRNPKRAGVGGSAWMLYRSSQMRGRRCLAASATRAAEWRRRLERAVRTEWLALSRAERAVWQRRFQDQVSPCPLLCSIILHAYRLPSTRCRRS